MKFRFLVRAVALLGLISTSAMAQQQATLTGAGATFPAPLYHQWAADAQRHVGFQINYQSVGSGAGVNQIINRTVHFGASDAPLTPERLAQNNLLQIPTVTGSLVLAYNVPGVAPGTLRLTPEVLVAIYRGEIQMWNHARLVEINPGVNLPRLPIVPLYRADGSGTTWIFTQYLSRVSEAWRDSVGAGTSVRWPAGQGARGNEGVSANVARTRGAIGYVESSFAVINNLHVAQLRNRAGNFVQPTAENVRATAASAEFTEATGFVPDLLDQTAPLAWPIVGATYLLIPLNQADAAVNQRIVDFVRWSFAQGDASAVRLHYVPLPEHVKQTLINTLAQRLSAR